MNRLHPIAQAVQSQGRGKDTQLVHMTPNEVASMQALAKANGGSLSINPNTGLPEAGFLDSMLPTILGVGLAAATGGTSLALSPAMIGLGIGGLQFARTGDLGKGLMAGLGAWGGAGLAGSLGLGAAGAAGGVGSGATVAAPTIDPTAAANIGAQTNIPTNYAISGGTNAGSLGLNEASQGIGNLARMTPLPAPPVSPYSILPPPTATAMPVTGVPTSGVQANQFALSNQPTVMDKLGSSQFWKDNWKSAAAAAAPTAMDMMTPKGTETPTDNEQYQYSYDPGRVSEADLAAQRAANPGGELVYFRPRYQGPRKVNVAQGGILGYADGGIFGQAANLYKDVMGGAQEYEFDPVTRTYKEKKSASPVGAVAPVGIENSGGSSGTPVQLTKEQIDFFDNEDKSPGGARDQRMGKINDILAMLAPGSIARALVGGANSLTGGGAGQARAPVSVSSGTTGMTPNERSFIESGGYTADVPSADQGGYDPTSGYDTDTDMAKGGILHYENGGPTGAVEPIGINSARPIDQSYFKDMAANTVKNAAISKIGQAMGLSPQAMALGMAAKGIYGFFNPDKPAAPVMTGSDFPSVPGQNPSGDSGGNGGYTVGDGTQGSASMSDYGGEADLAQGGIAGLAIGGMSKGGFVVPADVVSALGNGSTDAGLRALQSKLGKIKPIKGAGDGLSDSIPTSIDGKQPARVADGEAYIDPSTVAKIGNGDMKKGAKKLYAMMARIRDQAHGKKTQQRKVSPSTII
jgi:hypothetical protein